MRPPLNAGVRQEVLRGLQIIWLMFVSVAGFYALILLLLSQQSEAPDLAFLDLLRSIVWMIAGILAVGSFVWRLHVAETEPVPGRSRTDAFVRLRVACIVTWSFCEGVAILGLVLGFLSHRFFDYFPLVTLGIVLLFVHRPAVWPIERTLRVVARQ